MKLKCQMSKVKCQKPGFTLVELLVSLSILGVITGQMLANFRAGQRVSEVRFAAEILANQLRELQTNALTGRLGLVCAGGSQNLMVCEGGKEPPVACEGGTCEERVPAGYGIRFSDASPESFLLFIDTDGDFRYDEGEELRALPYVSTGQVRFGGSTAASPLDIVFRPPFARAYVNGVPDAVTSVTVTLVHAVGPQERDVTVNLVTGKIDHAR